MFKIHMNQNLREILKSSIIVIYTNSFLSSLIRAPQKGENILRYPQYTITQPLKKFENITKFSQSSSQLKR